MKFEYEGENWEIEFGYDEDTKGRRRTHAYVIIPAIQYWLHGCAVCSKKDQFSKAVGRRIALLKALESADRAFRVAVFRAYESR